MFFGEVLFNGCRSLIRSSGWRDGPGCTRGKESRYHNFWYEKRSYLWNFSRAFSGLGTSTLAVFPRSCYSEEPPPQDSEEDAPAEDGAEATEPESKEKEAKDTAERPTSKPSSDTSPTSSTRTKTTKTHVSATGGFFEDELRGYRLLKACGLQSSERQQILTLTGNTTTFQAIRQALRAMFDEGVTTDLTSRRHRPLLGGIRPRKRVTTTTRGMSGRGNLVLETMRSTGMETSPLSGRRKIHTRTGPTTHQPSLRPPFRRPATSLRWMRVRKHCWKMKQRPSPLPRRPRRRSSRQEMPWRKLARHVATTPWWQGLPFILQRFEIFWLWCKRPEGRRQGRSMYCLWSLWSPLLGMS